MVICEISTAEGAASIYKTNHVLGSPEFILNVPWRTSLVTNQWVKKLTLLTVFCRNEQGDFREIFELFKI